MVGRECLAHRPSRVGRPVLLPGAPHDQDEHKPLGMKKYPERATRTGKTEPNRRFGGLSDCVRATFESKAVCNGGPTRPGDSSPRRDSRRPISPRHACIRPLSRAHRSVQQSQGRWRDSHQGASGAATTCISRRRRSQGSSRKAQVTG